MLSINAGSSGLIERAFFTSSHCIRRFIFVKNNYDDNPDYRKFIKIEKNLYRPSEVDSLLGDCRKAKRELKWKPKYNFKKLVEDMVRADLEFVEKEGY